jgi:hypothetical protein
LNRILAFQSGLAADGRGRYLRDIQQWPDERLEMVHDFIQWMFPLPEPSGVNPDAPVLDRATIAAFESAAELRTSFLRMLSFYGLQYTDGKVTRAPNFAERAPNWLAPGNHNHLRITRILKCLRLLGLEAESRAFYECLVGIHAERPQAITERTFRFWMETQ